MFKTRLSFAGRCIPVCLLLTFAFHSRLEADSADGDTLPDDWELSFFSDLSQDDLDDPDFDGLTNIQEFNVGSNPTLADTDGDELRDGDEINIHNSSPVLPDTDGDGLDDGDEVNASPATDPAEVDTDGDGLSDGEEVSVHGTNPTLSDSDGDTFEDLVEIAAGSDPLDSDEVPSFPDLNDVLISEFMASNNSALLDEDGDASDWLELWNPTGSPVSIGGWFLTDDPGDPTRWQLPAGLSLAPGEFLVIFASGKDRSVLGSELHADFKLDKAAGSFLALFRPDGQGGAETVTAYAQYPTQEEDVSYGVVGDASPLEVGYFLRATPGGANPPSAVDGFVNDTSFSVDRGFYDAPFDVMVTSATPGASIIYTTDGTMPTLRNGTVVDAPNSDTPPSATVRIDTTTCLRAMATKSGFEPTNVDTQTYIFAEDVLRQSGASLGGQNWGHSGRDWEMDPTVVRHRDRESKVVADDLKEIPTVSLVLPFDDFFGSGGIYISGESVEKACSIEYINPAEDPADPNSAQGFQVDGTVQIVGGSSTGRWKSDKLSMRLKFNADLRYPIFNGAIDGETATRRFDTLVLDARLNNVWTHPSAGQNILGQYTRDQYVADLQNAVSGPGSAPHGRPVHVYIRGIYWGMFPMHERPDDNFAAEYFGGDNDDYDVMKHRDSTVVHGTDANWRRLSNLASRDMRDQSNYVGVTRLLDVQQMIDYLLVNFYAGNTDWSHQNWYASFNKVDPDGRWRFHSWDPEHTLKGANDNVTGDARGGATRLHSQLRNNPEYRLLFADRIRKHFFNDGVMSPASAAARYQARIDTVNEAVRCESARWGDNRRSTPYLRGVEWMNEYNRLMNSYFPGRTQTVFNQLRGQNLYPALDAPEFTPHGGSVPVGFELAMRSPDGGRIYYTLDGSDPRVPATGAQVVTHTLVEESASKRGSVPASGADDADWFTEEFDDNHWAEGTMGAGYETQTRFNSLLDPDLDFADTVSEAEHETIYLRSEFEVDDPALFDALLLQVRYDDGFVAYLNGTEIERENAPGPVGTPVSWNAEATASHRDDDAEVFQPFPVSEHLDLLKPGTNVLAVHGLNRGLDSSDFLIWATLEATEGAGGEAGGLSASAVRYDGPVLLSAPGSVHARVLSGDEWSAVTEATFLVGVDAAGLESLVISKIHYRPGAPSASEQAAGHNNRNDFEYVELMNIGPQTIDLAGVRFTTGVEFAFSDGGVRFLAPGERVLIVENESAFAMRYGAGLPVAGEFAYETELENAGEQLVLVDSADGEIRNFAYDDRSPWPESADGAGFALVLIDPFGNPDHGVASNWRASSSIGGNPGRDDGLNLDTWREQNFTASELADPNVSGPTANAEGDETTVIEEFLFGGDPKLIDSAEYLPFVTVEEISGSSYVVFNVRLRSAAVGVSWEITSSTELTAWEPPNLVELLPVDLGDGTKLRRFRTFDPLSEGGLDARFFRIEIE